ncbi:protein inturned [Bradysia coprophila]|uniref:protein inturned n=1 Tax=Bradysia coprophila TaxID=38358 RepID=UPI00187DA20B|nr:protein inturned [Bradysia coprophila]
MSQDQKPLINTINTRQTRPPVDSEYSDSSSTSFSDSASYDSYAPDWSDWIDEDDGSLFYIEYNFQTISLAKQTNETQFNDANGPRSSNFSRALSTTTSTRRSKKSGSKLAKLINRNLKPMNKDTSVKTAKPGNSDSAKVKFSETAEGEVKIVSVMIDPSVRHKYGRRCTVCEALLGVVTSFAEGKRVIIDGFRPNSQLSLNKVIKVGDWLKAINDVEVSTDTIDSVLLNFQGPTEVRLSLQRTVAEESIIDHQNVVNKVTSLDEFVANAGLIFDSNKWDTDDMIFSVMYMTMKNSDEQSSDGQDVLFCYPVKEKNCLYTSRGSFLTLSSLLLSTFKTSPVATTMQVNNQDYHVIYLAYEEDLLIVALSSNYATLQEAKLKTTEIVRCIECLHQTVPTAIVHDHMWQNILSIVSQIYLSRDTTDNVLFEQALLEPHYVPLPKEAQIRIDDALGEMLAMDYREWNQDEPLKSHREFFMIGCSLYFKSYLLASHLPPVDLIDIEAYLRVFGIFNVLESQTVKDMVLWREIHPKSVERGLVQKDHIYGIPKGRWFLAVCARYHTLLAVILESRQMTSGDEQLCITPSPFYIEEIQDTLEHLRTGGVENLAVTWISSNKRPQVIQENNENPMGNTNPESQSKKTEIISILKRRNNSTENVSEFSKPIPSAGGSSVNSQTFSDDSNHKLDDDESDSDWDGFPDRSSSGFDVSELTETFLKEVSDVIPSKVTAGRENVLFHYVQLEIGQGVLLSSTGASKSSTIIKSFRKACLLIHTILQNTIRFRFLLSQESNNKPNWHRSLVAIKEHGILISIDDPENANDPVEFWVIGRLFSTPPKELYVCHRADVPQNLVELAFRLSLYSAG